MRIREGDPLEIFVSNEGEVIFKKYSPISELGSIAAQYCEVLYRTAGYPVLITDRDHLVAVSGIGRREVLERRVSHGLEDQIENRKCFSADDGQPLQPIEGVAYYALVQSPIISSGDVCGSVMFLQNKESDRPGDAEQNGELSREADGAVMVTGVPSVKDSLFFAVFSWMVHIPLWQLFDSCSS